MLKAQLLEVKEHMNYLPLKADQQGINTYSVRTINSKVFESGTTLIKFIGPNYALVNINTTEGIQTGKKLSLVSMPSGKDVGEEFEVIPKLKIGTQKAVGNEKLFLDFRDKAAVFMRLAHPYTVVQSFPSQNGRIALMACLTCSNDIFIFSESKSSADFRVFDGSRLDDSG